jgi:flagellar biosynthesis/type III secretory pathway chaperone
MSAIPDPQGLADELSEIIANLTSLEAIVYEEPTRLSAQEQQEIRQELVGLKTRLRRFLQ